LGDFETYAELSPAEVIASVTSLAAESCGIGDRKGRIAAAMRPISSPSPAILRKICRLSVLCSRCSGRDS